jgi:aminoglycoside phosphotransferase (APT) family kinase protein
MAEQEAVYARVLRLVQPGARLERFVPLQGGISAETIALEYRDAKGAAQTVVVRRIGGRTEAADRTTAAEQYELLRALHEVGLPVPEPLLLDESRTLLAEPYLILGYLPGVTVSGPPDPAAFARALARQLADIHRLGRGVIGACRFVPCARASYGELLAEPPFACTDAFPQREIRDALLRAWPLQQRNPDCLLHGDFHSGNVVWTDGQPTGVLDWADALIGDPLVDVSLTRLDLVWMLDDAAADTFTQAYLDATACDPTDLAHWDLFATLRPGSNLAAWASAWPALGRPDLTEQTMNTARDAFARRALARRS